MPQRAPDRNVGARCARPLPRPVYSMQAQLLEELIEKAPRLRPPAPGSLRVKDESAIVCQRSPR